MLKRKKFKKKPRRRNVFFPKTLISYFVSFDIFCPSHGIIIIYIRYTLYHYKYLKSALSVTVLAEKKISELANINYL